MAREAVRKSLVLLKNGANPEDPMLPLPKYVPRILVAGSHANNLGYQCGGWTITWQGVEGNNATLGTNVDFLYLVSFSYRCSLFTLNDTPLLAKLLGLFIFGAAPAST